MTIPRKRHISGKIDSSHYAIIKIYLSSGIQDDYPKYLPRSLPPVKPFRSVSEDAFSVHEDRFVIILFLFAERNCGKSVKRAFQSAWFLLYSTLFISELLGTFSVRGGVFQREFHRIIWICRGFSGSNQLKIQELSKRRRQSGCLLKGSGKANGVAHD